jgi:hypothetical protein
MMCERWATADSDELHRAASSDESQPATDLASAAVSCADWREKAFAAIDGIL